MTIQHLMDEASVRLRQARALPLTEVPATELADLCRSAHALIADAQAILLAGTAAAAKVDVAAREGASSMQSWIAQTTGVSAKQASRELKLAQNLDVAAPRTREAIGRPGVSTEKARIIADAMVKLPGGIEPSERDEVEDDLLARAERHSVEDLRRAAKRSLEKVDRALADRQEQVELEREERLAHRESTFWMSEPDADGMVSGGFAVPLLAAAMLRSGLESITAPRKACAEQEAAHEVEREDEPMLGAEALTYPQRLGRAFTTILEHLPTDCFGNHGGVAATLVVSIDHDQLVDDIGAASLSTGDRISAGEARRIACNAGIIPQVLGGKSLPLDLGTQRRLFSPAQRLALAHRDGGCAFPGCDRPPGWAEAHHMDYWSAGGSTDLALGVLLCGAHHRLIHHSGWVVRPGPDHRPEFVPPRHVDPQQRPRRNDRWRPLRPTG